MARIRIGFVGAGRMGQCAHLRNYGSLADCQVVALAEPRPKLAQAVATRYGIPRVYRDHRELIANERLDGIVAIQPYQTHDLIVPELLTAGVPVLIEKPLAASVEAGQRIVDAIHDPARLFVAYHKRSDPATQHAKVQADSWRSSGEAGNLRYIRLTMPPGNWKADGLAEQITTDEPRPEPPSLPPADGLSAEQARRMDYVLNYYAHQFNLLRHLLRADYRVSYADPAGVLMVAHSEDGIPASLEMAPYTTSTDWQESILICFEHGWIRLELPAPLMADQAGKVVVHLAPQQGEPRTVEPVLPLLDAMRAQAQSFLAEIRGERAALCEAQEALEDLRSIRDYVSLCP